MSFNEQFSAKSKIIISVIFFAENYLSHPPAVPATLEFKLTVGPAVVSRRLTTLSLSSKHTTA